MTNKNDEVNFYFLVRQIDLDELAVDVDNYPEPVRGRVSTLVGNAIRLDDNVDRRSTD